MKKNNNFSTASRRQFIKTLAVGAGAIAGAALSGCNSVNPYSVTPHAAIPPQTSENSFETGAADVGANFLHGVASGDPLHDRVIIWTRATPEADGIVELVWQISLDSSFADILLAGSLNTDASRDYTVKIDVDGLNAGSRYFYRFLCGENISPVGRTKTLPIGAVDEVKLAAVSCAKYASGYFHVYNEISQRDDLDALLHLGDYIYEYGFVKRHVSSSALENNPRLQTGEGRELLSLEDYRREYAVYHKDPDLQAAHASLPFITVWDDHEIANDLWKHGAVNHTPETEGDLNLRKEAAIQAYFEWLPIREPDSGKRESVYRAFDFGDLVSLNMLDTRVIGRDEPLEYQNFVSDNGDFDQVAFELALNDSKRELLGQQQKQWLQQRMSSSTATWQVLGQQVMMGNLAVPAPLALNQMTYQDFRDLRLRSEISPELLSEEDINVLNQPSIPYNLHFWDGYTAERGFILDDAITFDNNLVVLSADTHNAWANNLVNQTGIQAGVEFSTASVSSQGIEAYRPWEDPETLADEFQALVENLKYCEIGHRGYMVTTFNPTEVSNEWIFVDTVFEENYSVLGNVGKTVVARAGQGIE